MIQMSRQRETTPPPQCAAVEEGGCSLWVLFFDRGEYQVTEAHFARTDFGVGHVLIVLFLPVRVFEARSPVKVTFLSRRALRSSFAVRARGLAWEAADPHRE
jgi:hypothetical protein